MPNTTPLHRVPPDTMTTSPSPLSVQPVPASFTVPVAAPAAPGPRPPKPTRVLNSSLPAEVKAAARWRALLSGQQLRRTLSVTTLAPGMIAVRLHGPPALLERMGLRSTAAGPQPADSPASVARRVAWVSLDARRFSGHVVQGDSLLDPCLHPAGEDPSTACVRINGGYFNFRQRACVGSPEHLPIGSLRTRGGAAQPALQVPPAFVDDYRELAFGDGSSLASAPLLAERGEAVFALKASGNPCYRLPPDFSFERGDVVAPGMLWHAHDANPRVAISVPAGPGNGRIRLVAAPMVDRSCADTGWTLSAFSAVLARLDRQHSPPNLSLNLDGGESVALMAWAEGRTLLDVRQTLQPRHVGNLIEFRAGPPRRSPEMVRCVRLAT